MSGAEHRASGIDSRSTASAAGGKLIRQLGLQDSIAIVMGTMIGSGIFLVPGPIARQLHSLSSVILVWLVGGALSLFGALSLGELGAMFPSAGGLYVYLLHAYGRGMGFIYGWTAFVLINTGSIATMAVGLGTYVAPVLHLSYASQRVLQIASIGALTAIQCFGVKLGKSVQNLLTAAKVGGLGFMVIFLLSHGSLHRLGTNFWPAPDARLAVGAVGIALIATLWAYDGWHVVSFTAGEIKDASRTLPLSLLIGTLLTVIIYVVANVSYYAVLEPAAIRSSDRVAAVAMSHVMGPAASGILNVLIIMSILGAMNGNIFTTPRITWAMARDGLFFRIFGRVSPRYHTPNVAIAFQGIWASLLTLIGSFQDLFTYVMFVAWIFYGLSVAAVVILRVRRPELHRPYRCPGYPYAPALFLVATVCLIGSTVVGDPKHSLLGICLAACGLPLYLVFRRSGNERANPGPA